MPAGMENNLYPPLMNTFSPAFVRNTPCRIYFSLSIYNKVSDIKNVQVIISDQNTNISSLKSDLYPSAIKITTLGIDNNIIGDDKYYITISPGDLEGGIFELNRFYKVQIRFTSTSASNITDSKKIASWLTENQKYFSEWSRVCLIKGIEKPDIYIRGFDDQSNVQGNGDIVFKTEIVDFVGNMYFSKNEEIEKEYLKYYQIKLFDEVKDILLYDSDIIYTNEFNPNEINHTIKYHLEDAVNYKITISYTTNNDYSSQKTYRFSILQGIIDVLEAKVLVEPDDENGRMLVSIVADETKIFFGNITIRRASNKTNYTVWEDVHTTTINSGEFIKYDWYDYTAESGVWYRYGAQKRNTRGERGKLILARYPKMLLMEHMFLCRENMQVKIMLNPAVNSFKRAVSEAKTDTIGSKYPYIRRNGAISYRQFSITGLINSLWDEDGIFLNKNNIYGDSKVYYDDYNEKNNIPLHQDFVYEKHFRDKIIDFLYENNIKLFKSPTEGNILVRLMDINFSPNQTLGRRVYTFTATAYEMDECSLDNYQKYGIQSIGEIKSYITYSADKIGQLSGNFYSPQENIINILTTRYGSTLTLESIYIKWLRLEFLGDPYLIKTEASGSIRPLNKNESTNEDTAYGYIVYINEVPIIINKRGYYELRDPDVNVSSIWFPIKTECAIDYIVKINQTEDTSDLPARVYHYTKVSQICDTFKVKELVSKRIYLKHLIDYKVYYEKVSAINKIIVEAMYGAVIYVKDSFDETYGRHIIGKTNRLEFYNDDSTIDSFYFAGIHLFSELDDTVDETREEDFVETGIEVESIDEIDNPERNGVYLINNERMIYFQMQWFKFNEMNDVLCPVEASVDYIYEIIRGEF